MPEQLPKHVKPLRSSCSVFNFLHRNSDTQLLRQAVKPCAGDLTGAKQAKSSVQSASEGNPLRFLHLLGLEQRSQAASLHLEQGLKKRLGERGKC